jgi:Saxitoxin biosynthesis operon protein SxtJ
MHNAIEPKQLRSFGLIVGGIFAAIGLWPAVVHGEDVRLWVVALAGLLLIPALVRPRSLQAVYRVWMQFGEGLGWINSRIVLGVIFYGLFTPVGLIMRLRGKDPMRRHWEPEADTYRLVRQPRPSSHMTRQF